MQVDCIMVEQRRVLLLSLNSRGALSTMGQCMLESVIRKNALLFHHSTEAILEDKMCGGAQIRWFRKNKPNVSPP